MTNYDKIQYNDFTITNRILYKYSENSKVIVMPNVVAEIGKKAFFQCSADIIFPESCECGKEAFTPKNFFQRRIT